MHYHSQNYGVLKQANVEPSNREVSGSQKRYQCTIIVLQEPFACARNRDHVHIEFSYNPSSTLLQFKAALHRYLEESEHKNSLQHPVSHYCDVGILDENISRNDLFEVSDDDLMNDCVTPHQTIYLYHPSMHHRPLHDCTQNEPSIRHLMDIDRSCRTQQDAPLNPNNAEVDRKEKDTFFNSINLHFAYIGRKYGVGQGGSDETIRSHLVQICHSLLIWGLRKMDQLWKQKEAQDKMAGYLKQYSFGEKEIIDIIIFGNKLTDDNALHLIEHSPWMVSEPKLRAETYDRLKGPNRNRNQFSGCAAIQEEQKASGDQEYIVDHPLLHEFNEDEQPPCDSYDAAFFDPIDAPLADAQKTSYEQVIKNGPRRWPAQEGMLMYCYQFVFGLCSEDALHRYVNTFGKNIGLAKRTVNYLMLLCQSDMGLGRSLWKFAEMKHK